MKPLLETTAPLYLKRLARELNSLPDGFYLVGTGSLGNARCNRAAYRAGFLQVIPCGNRRFRAIPADSEFIDAYGRSVCASRTA